MAWHGAKDVNYFSVLTVLTIPRFTNHSRSVADIIKISSLLIRRQAGLVTNFLHFASFQNEFLHYYFCATTSYIHT